MSAGATSQTFTSFRLSDVQVTRHLPGDDVRASSVPRCEMPATLPTNTKSVPLCSKRDWVPDRRRLRCSSCDAAFTPFRRRSHCRSCGEVFCRECCERVACDFVLVPTGCECPDSTRLRFCGPCRSRCSCHKGLSTAIAHGVGSGYGHSTNKIYYGQNYIPVRQSREPP